MAMGMAATGIFQTGVDGPWIPPTVRQDKSQNTCQTDRLGLAPMQYVFKVSDRGAVFT